MKKLLSVSFVLFLYALNANAQDGERIFRKFKGDVSLGYAFFPGNSDIKNGFIFSLEPKFAVLDRLAIGGRIETDFLGKEVKDVNGYDDGDIKIKVYESFVLNADFYFTNNFNVRPFIGAGGGLYSVYSSSTADTYSNYNDDGGQTTVKVGGMFRAGIELRHFRIAAELNLVPNSKSSSYYYDSVNGYSTLVEESSKNTYIGLKAGFCFGGGPKNK